jgi:hypoxanthine-DNA glycosylase
VSLLRGLPPIVDQGARVLILGSFPSAASLAAGQYYAHPRNQFWPILSAILGQPLAQLAYEQRMEAVRAAGIAIWDVYGQCSRQGSLDAAIRHGVANDFAALKNNAPRLGRVCFNGQSAGRFAPTLAAMGFETLILPSTSPAHAGMNFAAKLERWQAGLQPISPA